jgi:hypothetical protein
MTNIDTDRLSQNVTKQDEQYFEEYIQQRPCSQCGQDHRFRPNNKGVPSSIHHMSELITLFFQRGLK